MNFFKRLLMKLRGKKEEQPQQQAVYTPVYTPPTPQYKPETLYPDVTQPVGQNTVYELPFYNRDCEKYVEEVKGVSANIPVGAVKVGKMNYIGTQGVIPQPTKLAPLFPPVLADETLMQYAIRTSPITGFPVSSVGGFIFNAGAMKGTTWQEKVEYSMNPWPYLNAEEQQKQREAEQYFIDERNKFPNHFDPNYKGELRTESDRLMEEGKIKRK